MQKLKFDFVKQWHHLQGQNHTIKNQPLARALGLKKRTVKIVLDATCGTGRDSLLILSFGIFVWAYERNPFVAKLIWEALEEAKRDPALKRVLMERFSFHQEDCRNSRQDFFDAIYYDPMYQKKGKALPRKEMQIFRDILKNDKDDKEEFFKWSMKRTRRLVVKRPLKGHILFDRPDITYKGKSTRYDVYLGTSLK